MAEADEGRMRKIGLYRQLFVDELLVESMEGVVLAMKPPYQDHAPVLVPDRPWEGRIGAYNTVIKEGDRWRMWYHVFLPTNPPDAPVENTYQGHKAFFKKYPYLQFICYAESADGVHWDKPDLGLHDFKGSRKNNIVLDPSDGRRYHGCCVFVDPSAKPREQYKMWAPLQALSSPDDAEPAPADGVRQFYSSDGINWKSYDDQPNPPGNYDSYNTVLYDVRLGRYVGYKRHWTQDAEGVAWSRYRAIHRWESPDFRGWTMTGEIKLADEMDQSVEVDRKRPDAMPIMDFYTQPVVQHPENPHLYLMFPSPFWHWGEPKWGMAQKGGFPDRLDVQLAVSRDGIAWQRVGERRPFLRPGMPGDADSACVYAFLQPIDVGDETWLYYQGGATKHGANWWEGECGIFRARMRRDGFVSADASYHGGELITVPIRFEGSALELNADTSAGGVIRVEILDEAKQPVEGFTLADADELNGNDIHMKVTWDDSSDVGKLVGKAIRLRFVMRDTKLYSFQLVGE